MLPVFPEVPGVCVLPDVVPEGLLLVFVPELLPDDALFPAEDPGATPITTLLATSSERFLLMDALGPWKRTCVSELCPPGV